MRQRTLFVVQMAMLVKIVVVTVLVALALGVKGLGSAGLQWVYSHDRAPRRRVSGRRCEELLGGSPCSRLRRVEGAMEVASVTGRVKPGS